MLKQNTSLLKGINLKSENVQHEVDSCKLLQNGYNFTMKILKNICWMDILTFSLCHKGIYSARNLWEELLCKKLFAIQAKKKKDVNRDKRKRMGRERTEYELCSENKTDVKGLWNTEQKFSLISHFISSGCLEIIQCLSMKLADWKTNSLPGTTNPTPVNSLPFAHLVPGLSRPCHHTVAPWSTCSSLASSRSFLPQDPRTRLSVWNAATQPASWVVLTHPLEIGLHKDFPWKLYLK